jgi:hypothetical protein
MWRNLADAPVSETGGLGPWGFESLHPHFFPLGCSGRTHHMPP